MNRRPGCLSRWLIGFVAYVAGASLASSVLADDRPAPPPVEESVRTRDGVDLRLTYFPSLEGRDAGVVVILHDFNETRAAYQGLAAALQDPARAHLAGQTTRAVLTVDLRGHGQSKTAYNAAGAPVELDATRFRADDFADMVFFDLEAVRSVLFRKNEAGELNLNKLCVVGVGMGANVAAVWTEKDWRTPNLPVRKQAQDVKALVLISPRWNYRGLSLAGPMQFPPIQSGLSVFLAYGEEDSKVAADGQNIYKLLDKFRPAPPIEQLRERQTLFQYALPTTLQGLELISRPAFGLTERIDGFLTARLDRQNFPWVRRTLP
jgi:pimeloyl-ACP methyl ester carboxylesterase